MKTTYVRPLSIRELPDVATLLPPAEDMISSPLNPDDLQHRSVFEALKIAFFKLKLTHADQGQFAWVKFAGAEQVSLEKKH